MRGPPPAELLFAECDGSRRARADSNRTWWLRTA